MPWKEATKMSEREELMRKWNSKLYTVSELAEQFGVSRPSVYLRIERSKADEGSGLEDRTSAPKSCPHRTEASIAARLIEAKHKHPNWGPQKLIQLLRRDEPELAWPAPSTAGRILEAEGLVRKRRRVRRQTIAYTGPLHANESGEMMTADHKGEFRLGNRQYCYPITINEPVSRFVYAIDGARSTSFEEARPSFERVFVEHGIPSFMGSDRGGPFCCTRALAGLSRLTVWWIKLGITPVRTRPASPWENGIHERMHKTLKAETTRPPAANMNGQQKKFDRFREEFNNVRPHESLDGQAPSTLLRPCKRPYPPRMPAVEYPGHYEVRRVRPSGEIKWQGRRVFVSETLAGEPLGLEQIDDGVWAICFASVELGRYDERTKCIS